MTRDDWLELTVLEKKKYNHLVEIQDVTRQLAEGLDRNDQVSVRMLVAMRHDPIRLLAEVDEARKLRMATMPEEDQARIRAMTKGAEARDDGERVFQEQANKTRRLLEQVVDLDQRVSVRMAGGSSFYNSK